MAELTSMRCGVKLAGDHIAASDELGEGSIDGRAREVPPSHDIRGDEWDMSPCPPPKQRDERPGTGFEVGIRQANRQRHAKRLSVSACIVCRYPPRLAGDANGHRPALTLQLTEPLDRDTSVRSLSIVEIAQPHKQVVGFIRVTRKPLRQQSLKLELDRGDGGRIEELAQILAAQKLGQELSI
jgi:hypothetical protein